MAGAKHYSMTLAALAGVTVLLATSVARGQGTSGQPSATPPAPTQAAPAQTAIAGRTAFDLLPIEQGVFSLPLRFGNVITGSETVDLEGRVLARGKDYEIDYSAGTIVLKTQARPGQSLRVQYRYDHSKSREGTYGLLPGSNGNTFTFAAGGGMSFAVGVGLTERLGDGSTISSNVFGVKNNFGFAGGQVSGVFMIGERRKSNAMNLMGSRSGGNQTEEGTGTAIVQSFSSKVSGGDLNFYYQDIERNFNSFNAFSGSYDQNTINWMARERGLKRSGFNLNQANFGGLKVSAGQRSVGDAAGEIEWENYGVAFGGFNFNLQSFSVDQKFSRFNDIREEDRGQLAKERGLERTLMSASQAWKGGKISFDSTEVNDLKGNGLLRSSTSFESGILKGSFFRQEVDKGFTRFQDLREKDWQQLAREGGLTRSGFNFDFTPSKSVGLKYGQSNISSEKGGFTSLDASLAGRGWNFSHIRRGTDKGFASLGSLAEADIQSWMTAVARMVDQNLQMNGNDRGGFFASAGTDRSLTRFSFDFAKESRLAIDRHNITSQSGELNVTRVDLATKNTQVSFRQQDTDKDFGAGGSLAQTEQQRLGMLDGLSKTDLSLATQFSPHRKLNGTLMQADHTSGSALRQSLSFNDKGFELHFNRRMVERGFGAVNQIVDPERDALRNLLGFDQTEIRSAGRLLPNLGFGFHQFSDQNLGDGEDRFFRATNFDYSLNPKTRLRGTFFEGYRSTEDSLLASQKYSLFQFDHDFGRAGKVNVAQEKATFEGQEEQRLSSIRNTFGYETRLNATTSFRTERSERVFEDGTKETELANTVSTNLGRDMGVSVTESRINRDGEQVDETKRNYGFWWQLTKDVRFNYGYNRHLNTETRGTMQKSMSVTPGTVGGLKVNQATYANNMWDNREQYLGNVSLANSRPLTLGILSDIRFHYVADTQRDWDRWQRENRSMGFGASIGSVAFGLDYNSMVNPNQDRAIDRIFSFTTDKANKAPVRASIRYGVRTLPNNEDVMIRDFSVFFQPNKHLVLSHSVVTNQLQQRQDLILGSLPIDERRNIWNVKWMNDADTTFDFSWNEVRRDRLNDALYREGKVNARLFANNPSPLDLSYSVLQWERNGQRQTAHRFGFSYIQKPGPNQNLSFTLENLNWQHSRPTGASLQNWNLRLDYGIRF
ncbi:MAG: hypothetical protein MUC92_07575 [Fimbriimonadaceae bacterium]|jgi:hypothetical protein|nr:hypothetical protein [Fimbriimonadaceae bacterium]